MIEQNKIKSKSVYLLKLRQMKKLIKENILLKQKFLLFLHRFQINQLGRLNNIKITCGILDGHIIHPSETFSFEDLVGPSTEEKGYQEASVIVDGKTEQSLGGGNCQVSSTLYNAVKEVDSLEVIERHNHGKEVYYVPLGSDAAVAHDSCDFRFTNNSENDIKMYLSSDEENVYATLVKLEYEQNIVTIHISFSIQQNVIAYIILNVTAQS